MSKQERKIVQYLSEAHGAELGLVRQLQAQIAMTPRGAYRDRLEAHLRETRRHAERLELRLGELGQGGSPLQAGLGAVQSLVGQALALTRTPLALVPGSGGEEKLLKNAKDSCAAEALEIATYSALARPAAVCHSILTAAWDMLQTGETYTDPGGDFFARRDPDRTRRRFVGRLECLGCTVTLQEGAAAA